MHALGPVDSRASGGARELLLLEPNTKGRPAVGTDSQDAVVAATVAAVAAMVGEPAAFGERAIVHPMGLCRLGLPVAAVLPFDVMSAVAAERTRVRSGRVTARE